MSKEDQIVQKLIEGTRNNSITWKKTNVGNLLYQTTLSIPRNGLPHTVEIVLSIEDLDCPKSSTLRIKPPGELLGTYISSTFVTDLAKIFSEKALIEAEKARGILLDAVLKALPE